MYFNNSGKSLIPGSFYIGVHPKIYKKTDRPLWTFVIFGDIIKPHVNIYIFNVKSKEEQENGKKNEDHGR